MNKSSAWRVEVESLVVFDKINRINGIFFQE